MKSKFSISPKGEISERKFKKEEMNEAGNWLGMAGCGTGRRKQPSWKYKQLPCKGLAWQLQRLSAFWALSLTEG